MYRLALLLMLCAAGCTAGRVGQRERDAGGGGGMDGDVRLDAANPRDGDLDDAGGGGGGDSGPDAANPLLGELVCNDGVDNDNDMLPDCLDPDCDGLLCQGGVSTVTCQDQRCVCGSAMAEDEGPESCGDGIDSDCDGMLDCADPECDGVACGPGPVSCTGGVCPCADGFKERTCDNGADDDCDGMIDCLDPDCMGLRCGSDGFVCSVAMMCECPGAGMPETFCDGEDNNCNGTTDESCPTGIARSNAMSFGPYGNGGGSAFVDACPPGSALVGIAGQAPTSLTSLQPICAGVVFIEDTEPFQHEYRVERGATIPRSIHGAPGGATFMDLCPDDTFAIGVRGDADNAVDQVRLLCGRVSITMVGVMSFRLDVTPAGETPARGSTGTITMPFNAPCPVNGVVTQISGMDNDSRVTQLGFRCERLSLNLR